MEKLSPLAFCPVLDEMYRTGIAVGRSGASTSLLGGLSTINNLLAIRHFMRHVVPIRTLEIGLACGGSALVFAALHRELGSAPKRQHIAIDAFQKDFDDIGLLNLQRAGLSDYVQVLQEVSALALPAILKSGETFDIIYLDGSHNYDDVFCDFYYASRIISCNGYIMFDDSSDRNVRRVIRYVVSDLQRTFRRVPMSEYRARKGLSRIKDSVAELLEKNQMTIFQKLP